MSPAGDDLAGSRVLLTGGSMGIGREVSRELAGRGARVIVAARGVEAIDTTLHELDGDGHEGLRLDVSDQTAWRAAIERIDTGGALNGIVTAARVARLTENVAAADEIELNCVAPGFVVTRMHEQTLRAGPEAAGGEYYERTRVQVAEGGFPATEAAELISFLLSAEARGISGRLLSAQWDPWREQSFRAAPARR